MILINNNWEQVEDVQDGLKIIEDNLGKEFAQKFVSILLSNFDTDIYHRNKFKNLLYKYIGTHGGKLK